jgi:hypothetical protein
MAPEQILQGTIKLQNAPPGMLIQAVTFVLYSRGAPFNPSQDINCPDVVHCFIQPLPCYFSVTCSLITLLLNTK